MLSIPSDMLAWVLESDAESSRPLFREDKLEDHLDMLRSTSYLDYHGHPPANKSGHDVKDVPDDKGLKPGVEVETDNKGDTGGVAGAGDVGSNAGRERIYVHLRVADPGLTPPAPQAGGEKKRRLSEDSEV